MRQREPLLEADILLFQALSRLTDFCLAASKIQAPKI